jgi:hypothetical protein
LQEQRNVKVLGQDPYNLKPGNKSLIKTGLQLKHNYHDDDDDDGDDDDDDDKTATTNRDNERGIIC